MSDALALLDMLVLATLLLSMLLGAWRGLVYELLMLVGWVVAFFAARFLAPELLPQASAYFPSAAPAVVYAGVFVVLFIALTFAWGLLASLAKKLIQMVGLRPVDRVFGAGFGLVRALVLLLVATVLVQAAGWQGQSWWRQSVSATWLEGAAAQALPSLPQQWGRLLQGGAP